MFVRNAAKSTDAATDNGGRLPTYLIVGAARAGTTSLAAYLSEHPDVFVAAEKELNYFDREIWRGPAWYRERFAGGGPKRVIGEASVSYMYDPQTPARIAALVPDVRLIAILRNPVDRAESHYWFARAWGAESRPFSEAVFASDDPYDFAYLARGRYHQQILRLLGHFSRESLLVLLFEDLQQRPAATFAALCRHIGADDTWIPQSVGRIYNAGRTYRWEGLQRFLHRAHTRRRLPKAALEPLNVLNRRATGYPPMDQALRRALVDHYHDDNRALGELLGRDLSAWNASELVGGSVAARA